MNENLKILFEKLEKDEAALAKLKAVKDPDEAYALVSAIQGGYTKDEFLDVVKQIQGAADGELSDNEVAAAAGGMSSSVKESIVATSTIIGAAATNASV